MDNYPFNLPIKFNEVDSDNDVLMPNCFDKMGKNKLRELAHLLIEQKSESKTVLVIGNIGMGAIICSF
jgi:hypothetical protein